MFITSNPGNPVGGIHYSVKKFFKTIAFTRPDYKALTKELLLQAGIINFPEEDLNEVSFTKLYANMRWQGAVAFEAGKYKRMFPESTDALNY